jgi:hypothetical protein
VVDLGSWLGSLTVSLARGIRATRAPPARVGPANAHPRPRHLDCSPASTTGCAKPPTPGATSREIDFRERLRRRDPRARRLIETHQDEPDGRPLERRPHRPCWSTTRGRRLPIAESCVRAFFPRLAPGSLLLHQDYLWFGESFISHRDVPAPRVVRARLPVPNGTPAPSYASARSRCRRRCRSPTTTFHWRKSTMPFSEQHVRRRSWRDRSCPWPGRGCSMRRAKPPSPPRNRQARDALPQPLPRLHQVASSSPSRTSGLEPAGVEAAPHQAAYVFPRLDFRRGRCHRVRHGRRSLEVSSRGACVVQPRYDGAGVRVLDPVLRPFVPELPEGNALASQRLHGHRDDRRLYLALTCSCRTSSTPEGGARAEAEGGSNASTRRNGGTKQWSRDQLSVPPC